MKRKFVVMLLSVASCLCLTFGLLICLGGCSSKNIKEDPTQLIVNYDGYSSSYTYYYSDGYFYIPTPHTRIGYSFVKWYYYSTDGSGVKTFDQDALISLFEEDEQVYINVYAEYTIIRYTITYQNADESDIADLPTVYTVESGDIILPELSAEEGYCFQGWTSDGEYVTKIASGSYGNLTLIAVFTADTYTVYYNSSVGTLEETGTEVAYGSAYTLYVPEAEGYTFLGWYDGADESATQLTDADGESITAYTAMRNTNIYAHWQINTYTVTFVSNGGSEVSSQTYDYGSYFAAPDDPERANYLFTGWYDEDGSVQYSDSTKITENMTVYAHWLSHIAISDAAGLTAIADDPTISYYLTKDINLQNAVWTPIEEFSGVLDGCGYTIRNFMLSSETSTDNFAFIKINKGTVKNLSFSYFTYNVTVTPTSGENGAIIAGTNYGVIDDCSVLSNPVKWIFSRSTAGGAEYNYNFNFGTVAGANYGTISNCTAYADITTSVSTTNTGNDKNIHYTMTFYLSVGCIAGYNSSVITSCGGQGTITASAYAQGVTYYGAHGAANHVYIGGLIGRNSDGGSCTESYSGTDINLSSTYGGSYRDNYGYTGGLAGLNTGNGTKISSCYSTGTINGGVNTSNYIGGLVGYNTNYAQITTCYTTSSLTVANTSYAGGFVGFNESTIQNSYSSGNVSVDSSASSNVGGFVGNNATSGTIFKCYSTGNCSTTNGNIGYFCGLSDGIFNYCYYMEKADIGTTGTYTEYSNVTSAAYSYLWSKKFLVEIMYWDEEGWIIMTDDNPMFKWELDSDHYSAHTFTDPIVVDPTCTTIGYTVYVCSDCGKYVIQDIVQPTGHEDNVEYTHPATCTENEIIGYYCNNPTETDENGNPKTYYYEVSVSGTATGHSYSVTDTETKTDDDDDTVTITTKTYTCSNCWDTYTETITVKAISECVTETTYHYSDGSKADYTEITENHTPEYKAYEPADTTIAKDENGNIVTSESHTYDGHHSGTVCKVCGEILSGYETIPAHTYELTETKTAATCTSTGTGTYTCSECGYSYEGDIPALGHTDANGDHFCDTCGVFMLLTEISGINSFEEISTAEQLLTISKNSEAYGGWYILTCDIDLYGYDWTPIGTSSKPFTGVFLGKGYDIKGLSFTAGKDNDVLGLFGYNNGIIADLNVIVSSVSVSNYTDVVYGAVAAYNSGTIYNCTTEGETTLSYTVILTVNASASSSNTLKSTCYFGGIVGRNLAGGLVKGCTVGNTIKQEYICAAYVTNSVSTSSGVGSFLSSLTSYLNNAYASATQYIYFGGVAGYNAGTLSVCTVTGTMTASAYTTVDTVTLRGTEYAYTYMYAGSLVGYNSGDVTECSAPRMSYSTTNEYSDSSSLYTIGYGVTNYTDHVEGDGNSNYGKVGATENYVAID